MAEGSPIFTGEVQAVSWGYEAPTKRAYAHSYDNAISYHFRLSSCVTHMHGCGRRLTCTLDAVVNTRHRRLQAFSFYLTVTVLKVFLSGRI